MAKVGYILLGVGATGVVSYFVVFPYACPHCYLGHFRRFRTKEELEAHIAAEHPEEPVPYTLEVKVVEA
ncbi:unnamed protein product [marine sediment metagenome]|uniref:Uncharacterized protein n=1 Tax=marine sediment metagenome TaxID=412755 RepID=X1NC59_9ZZZZ